MWGNISHKSETGKFSWDESDIPFIYFILDNVSKSTHESFWTLAKSLFGMVTRYICYLILENS